MPPAATAKAKTAAPTTQAGDSRARDALSDRDHHFSGFDSRLHEYAGQTGVDFNSQDIQRVSNASDSFRILIHDGDIMAFLGKFLCKVESDYTRTHNEYSHVT